MENNNATATTTVGVPAHIVAKMDCWRGIFMFNEWAFKIGGVLSIVAGVMAAGHVFNARTTSLLALLAGMTTSVTSFLGWPTRASAYKAAWRLADQASMEYLSDPSPEKERKLIRAIFRGEKHISVVDH